MENLLKNKIRHQVEEAFRQLNDPVEILFFGRQADCETCDETRHLVEEITTLSDNLHLSIYDLETDSDVAQMYQIGKTPGWVIAAKNGEQLVEYGVRYAGVPVGQEFSSLIQDLILVSGRDSGLNQNTCDILADLTEPIFLQVFVTPTCPHCPGEVILAHQMAMESTLVQAEMVEAMEFPVLFESQRVSGVPQTTINGGAGTVVGAVNKGYLLAEIIRSVNAG